MKRAVIAGPAVQDAWGGLYNDSCDASASGEGDTSNDFQALVADAGGNANLLLRLGRRIGVDEIIVTATGPPELGKSSELFGARKNSVKG